MKQPFKRISFAAALVAGLLPSAGYSADISFRLMDASINEIHQAWVGYHITGCRLVYLPRSMSESLA